MQFIKQIAMLAAIMTLSIVSACGGSGDTDNATAYTVKLIKTDSTEVDTTARPIPLGTSFKITFESAISDETARTAVEAAVKLLDPNSAEVVGSFAWNTDYTVLTFAPSKRLDYSSEYTITITATTSTSAQVIADKAIDAGSYPFTTMVRGDFNGDGYADLLVGAAYHDVGSLADVGSAYIFNGSVDGISSSYTTKLEGSAATDYFGCFWDSADVNGDGYADALIGEPGQDGKGVAHVYLGSSDGIAATPSTSIAGGEGNENFGWRIVGAFDINGDGYDDIIICDPGYKSSSTNDIGAAYIHMGSADGIATTHDATYYGSAEDDHLCISASGLGDVNGDGYDDFIVGTGADKAYAYYGSSDGAPSEASETLTGGGDFGAFVSMAGDVNGDGYDDALIGATDANRAYIFYGSTEGIATSPEATFEEGSSSTFGFVAPAGDVNGDGYDDVVIGDIGKNGGKGGFYLYTGAAGGISTTAASHVDSSEAQMLGGVDPARDLNGDGYDDVVVGASQYDSDRGASYVYIGSSAGMQTSSPSRVTGEQTGDRLNQYY